MIAYAGTSGVMFVPEEIERKTAEKKVSSVRRSNDNKGTTKAPNRISDALQVEAAE